MEKSRNKTGTMPYTRVCQGGSKHLFFRFAAKKLDKINGHLQRSEY